MERLRGAFQASCDGHTLMVHMHGSSGMGKTALAQRFAEEVAARDTIVLGGRCYEREAVPYKVWDSLVDAMSRHLRSLPRGDVGELLPLEILSLTRIFPVLLRVEAIAAFPRRAFEIPDPQEVRRRAFLAFREFFVRLATRKRVVLWLDDVQWGDVDSAGLLAELLRPPEPPPLLLLLGYRTEEAATSPFLEAMRDPRIAQNLAAEVREIAVEPLGLEDAQALACTLLRGEDAAKMEQAQTIAVESHGSPFYVDELVRYLEVHATLSAKNVRLEDVLLERIAALSEDAQRLLDVIAIAGGPIAKGAALSATQLEGDPAERAIAVLRSAHLTRSTRQNEAFETFHDRVRETVTANLSEEKRREWHGRLAVALMASSAADPEALVEHFQASGDRERAGEYAVLAGDKAVATLAFERAARFYSEALELQKLTEVETHRLQWKLGDAFANGGFGAQAARAYLSAVVGASAADAIELRRIAAEQYLKSGHTREGLAVLREVLGAVGLAMSKAPWQALVGILLYEAYFRLRGYGFRRCDASQVSPAVLRRIDVCMTAASSLGMTDQIRGTYFVKRGVFLALRAGELDRVAYAMDAELWAVASAGGRALKRLDRMLSVAGELAAQVNTGKALGLVHMVECIAAYLSGRFRAGLEASSRAREVLTNMCTGVAWELANSEMFGLWSLWQRGEFLELSRRVPQLLSEARQRGDLYQLASVRLGLSNTAWLCSDDPEGARREASEAMADWPRDNVHLQHYWALVADVHVDLYEGAGELAMQRLHTWWKPIARALLFHCQIIFLEALGLRTRAALCAARTSVAPEPLLRSAERDIRRMEREKMPWSNAMAQVFRGALTFARGDDAASVAHLTKAVAALEACDMAMWATAARWRLGEVQGGDKGAELVAQAKAFMVKERIKNPERMLAMLAPGFSRALRGLLGR